MNKRILIVEDEATMQKILEDFLNQEGFKTKVASNGEEGIKMAKEETFDLMLLDIILPKKDGFEVLEELKKDGRSAKLPVILLTNLSDPGDIQRAIDLGAKTYLVKSEYQLEEIAKKIKQYLNIK